MQVVAAHQAIPILIETGGQLARVAEQINSGAESKQYYKLSNDIYLNDVSSVDYWGVTAPQNKWIPIGSSETQFTGSFDGANHTIYGLYISTLNDYQGLFGSANADCKINNLGIEKSYVKGGNYVGAVCGFRSEPGWVLSNTELSNCHNGSTVIGNDYVGGIFGRVAAELTPFTLKKCYNTGIISGNNYVGGLVGGSISVKANDCYNVGAVTGAEQVGGIAGKGISSTNCWNVGRVTGTTRVGGIFGEGGSYGGDSSSITSSFNAGTISGTSFVGGILGYSSTTSGLYPSNISNCYNVGAIKGTEDYIGGIAGKGNSCKYINCYNVGSCLPGTGENIGAVFNEGANSQTANCYYLSGCSGANYINRWPTTAVDERSSAQMRAAAFVDTLNNGGSAWLHDTKGYNYGYPILSGVDYSFFPSRDEGLIINMYPEANSTVDLWNTDKLECSITFSLEIEPGPGKIYLKYYETDDIITTFAYDDENATDWFDYDGNSLIFSLDAKIGSTIPRGEKLYLTVDPDAVILKDGSTFEGINDKDTWAFTTRFGLTAFSERVSFENSEEDFFLNYASATVSYPIRDTNLYLKMLNIIGAPKLVYYNRKRDKWPGACFGTSVVTALYKMNMIDLTEFDSEAETLFCMKKPIDSPGPHGVRDLINYYFLLQLVDNDKFSGLTGLDTKWASWFRNKDKFEETVKWIVEQGLTMDTNKKVLVLNYGWMDEDNTEHQHSVVLFSARKNSDGSYDLLIRDPNNGRVNTVLNTMHVSSDYSSFTYGTEDDKKDIIIVKALDVTEIPSKWLIGNTTATKSSEKGSIANDEYDTLNVVAYGNFTITNNLGETLIHDNGYLSGTMEVFFEDFVASVDDDYAEFVFKVNKSDGYTFTSEDSRSSCKVTDGANYIYVDADNASSIVMNKASGISIQGDDLKYSVYTTTATGNNFFAVTGQTDEYLNVTLNPDGSGTIEADRLAGAIFESLYEDTSWELDGDSITADFTETDDGGLSLPNAISNDPYTITVNASPVGGGTVTVVPESAKSGEKVTITATPNKGYTTSGVTVKEDNSRNSGSVTKNNDGTYTFIMPNGPVTVSASFTAIGGGNNNNGNGSSSSGTSYQITASTTENGTVTISHKSAKSGEKVTITATPDNGYTIGSVTVKDSSGKNITVTDNGDGTYTFTMPNGKVTVDVTFVENSDKPDEPDEPAPTVQFVDVSADAYYYDAVQWAVKNGITYGIDETHFSPATGCTRAQFVTFLWRAAGSPEPDSSTNPFSDVSESKHTDYYNAILWAAEQGVTVGTGNGKFSPDVVVTRAQSVTFMHRYAQKAGIATETGTPSFNDVSNEGALTAYYDSIGWAVANGITYGTGNGKFSPMEDCNRGMMITFLYRLFKDTDV